MPRLLIVFGTRPEAIKLCPLIAYIRKQSSPLDVRVCATAQHRSMLDQVLESFEIRPDHDLDLMRPDQTLAGTAAAVIQGVAKVIEDEPPDMIVVQGDTTTTLAAFYAHVPVAHVEAGLRTGDLQRPFPEEAVDAGRIFVTGNTVVDAVLGIQERLLTGEINRPSWPFISDGRKLILVTAHRRESFGEGLQHVCEALQKLAARQDAQIVYPVHRIQMFWTLCGGA
jgi:UDP-N-acetylglucosamine 2-epimerase (non-hydrolysing)